MSLSDRADAAANLLAFSGSESANQPESGQPTTNGSDEPHSVTPIEEIIERYGFDGDDNTVTTRASIEKVIVTANEIPKPPEIDDPPDEVEPALLVKVEKSDLPENKSPHKACYKAHKHTGAQLNDLIDVTNHLEKSLHRLHISHNEYVETSQACMQQQQKDLLSIKQAEAKQSVEVTKLKITIDELKGRIKRQEAQLDGKKKIFEEGMQKEVGLLQSQIKSMEKLAKEKDAFLKNERESFKRSLKEKEERIAYLTKESKELRDSNSRLQKQVNKDAKKIGSISSSGSGKRIGDDSLSQIELHRQKKLIDIETAEAKAGMSMLLRQKKDDQNMLARSRLMSQVTEFGRNLGGGGMMGSGMMGGGMMGGGMMGGVMMGGGINTSLGMVGQGGGALTMQGLGASFNGPPNNPVHFAAGMNTNQQQMGWGNNVVYQMEQQQQHFGGYGGNNNQQQQQQFGGYNNNQQFVNHQQQPFVNNQQQQFVNNNNTNNQQFVNNQQQQFVNNQQQQFVNNQQHQFVNNNNNNQQQFGNNQQQQFGNNQQQQHENNVNNQQPENNVNNQQPENNMGGGMNAGVGGENVVDGA